MSDLLTTLETAGGQGVLHAAAPLSERNALHLHVQALKAQGHAVVVNEVIENGEYRGTLNVLHYLSCRKCIEEM